MELHLGFLSKDACCFSLGSVQVSRTGWRDGLWAEGGYEPRVPNEAPAPGLDSQ